MSRRRNNRKNNWSELILFILIILCIYFILSLFDSPLAGDGGREWGVYLRNAWGGAFIVILLFWLYLCAAKLLKFRVPKLPRQILGTIQLYISFAFMLGLLKETGWNSEMTLFIPGNFGHGLAKFFVLNIGTFLTLLLVAGSFVLSAFFYGSKILNLSLPSFDFNFENLDLNSLRRKFISARRAKRRIRREREKFNDTRNDDYEKEEVISEYSAEKIFFPKEFPSPKFKADDAEISSVPVSEKNDEKISEISISENKSDLIKNIDNENMVEMLDNIIAKLSDEKITFPEKKRTKNPPRSRKIRRPVPEPENFDLNDDKE